MNPIQKTVTHARPDCTFPRRPWRGPLSPVRVTAALIVTLLAGARGWTATLPFITTFATDAVGQFPAGWTADLSSVPTVTAAAAAPGDSRSVLYSASDQGMKVSVGSTTNVQWDFWIRPVGTSRSVTVGTFDSSNRYGIWLSWGATSGQVSYYANGMWNTIPGGSFSANQWYRVRLVARLTPGKTFDAYISAAGSAALPTLPQGRNLPLRDTATANFATAKVGTYGSSASAYFDDSAIQVPAADGFEANAPGIAYPAGWTPTGTAPPEILASGADGSGRSLNLLSSSNRLELPFELADDATVDLKVYPTGRNRTLTFMLYDQAHHWGPYLAMGISPGQLSYFASNTWAAVPGVSLTTNSWHRIRLVARSLPGPNFDVYVSAANSDALPPSPQGVQLPVRDPQATDFQFLCLDAFGLTAPCRVDGVEITQGLEPSEPVLVAPAANATNYLPTPSFRWYDSSTGDNYEVQIATDANFANVVDSDSIPINRYVHDQALSAGAVYWRVRARGTGGLASAYSPGRKLTIQTPANVYNIAAGATASQIQSTVQGAVTPAVVNFAAGANYSLAPSSILMTLASKTNLIINGNGATITFTNAMCGLASLNKCAGVLLRDLTVDFNPVPFSVGTILSTNRSQATFTVNLDSGMPPFNAPHMVANWTWGVLLDPNVPGKIKDGTPIVINTVSNYVTQAGNQYTLKLTDVNQLGYFTPGAKYIQFARNNGGKSLFGSSACTDITCLNITNFAISAGHYLFLDGSDFKVLRCHSLIKSGRWFGGNADGVHARFNQTGPWVEGCEFYGVGDDSVALYSKGIFILQKLSDTAIRLDPAFFNLAPGDTFTLFNPRDGTTVAEDLTVSSVTTNSSPLSYNVSFTPAVTAAIETGFADGLQNDQVFNRTLLNQGFALRSNYFHSIRRYGSVIRASYGVIEGNTYEAISDVPIFCRNEPDTWRNGLQSTDLIIRNNLLIDSGFSSGAASKGQIQLSVYKLGSQYGAWRGHRRIQICDNEIWNWQERGIELRNAREADVAGNLITAEPGVVFSNARPHYGICVDNAQDSLLAANDIADPRTLTAPILVTNSQNITVQP